jgi:hypothetical protein
MEPLGHGAIRLRHLGDLVKHIALPVGPFLVRARFRLELSGALLHRGAFLVRESLGCLGVLLGAHVNLLILTYRPSSSAGSRYDHMHRLLMIMQN